MTLTLEMTDEAATRLSDIFSKQVEESDSERGVRISQSAGGCGCSGPSFGMGFDTAKPGDSVFNVSGIRFIIDGNTASNLEGASIDYVEPVEHQGFVIEAPNAKAAEGGGCGCG